MAGRAIAGVAIMLLLDRAVAAAVKITACPIPSPVLMLTALAAIMAVGGNFAASCEYKEWQASRVSSSTTQKTHFTPNWYKLLVHNKAFTLSVTRTKKTVLGNIVA